MVIKRKHFSLGAVITGGFNVMGVAGMASGVKESKQSKEEHQRAMNQAEVENKQLVNQLNNIAKA